MFSHVYTLYIHAYTLMQPGYVFDPGVITFDSIALAAINTSFYTLEGTADNKSNLIVDQLLGEVLVSLARPTHLPPLRGSGQTHSPPSPERVWPDPLTSLPRESLASETSIYTNLSSHMTYTQSDVWEEVM